MVSTGAARYLEHDVMSRSNEWLVPLMFEHLLLNLRRAAKCMEQADVGGRATHLGKASAILFELMGSLDRERGGAVAGQLGSLYGFLASELMDVGRSNDSQRLQRIIGMVAELHDGFRQAAESVASRGGSPVA
ncbi:MAG TPA: flagellar export chaperone FliS [Gemmatimonadales bacterium]|nr:flagellar export chaperone FliS [Gemmatimonadales bacterium]